VQYARTPFVLDHKALALGRASDVLAVDPRAIGSTLALRASAPLSDWTPPSGTEAPARVALVEVLGPIAQRGDTLCGFYDGWDTIEGRVTRALAADDVDAVVLVIDSPGGDVAGMAESIGRMRSAVAESGKPCLAYADECATSAAYALATVATKIYMPASGLTGSIGTVSIHVDESQHMADHGYKATIVRSGDRKFEGNSLEPISPEALNAKQVGVDRAANAFASLVATARGGDAGKYLALQGRVLLAPEALAAGLVDGIVGRDEVIQRAAAAVGDKRMNEQAKKAPTNIAAAIDPNEISALEVGRVAMALTGAADAEGAIKALRGWQVDAAKATALEADRLKAEQEAEAKERVDLVKGMVARGAVGPAKAWIVGEKGPTVGAVAEPWASMKIKHLRAAAGAFEEPTERRETKPSATDAATPTAAQIERAKQLGVKPESLAAAERELAAANIKSSVAALGG
jgi:ClpP class serine protease